jgi:H+/Cl- antiporter ClcA
MLREPSDAVRQKVLGLGTGLFKGAMILLGLLCGASIGREGPTVHIGAAIAHSLRSFARFPHHALNRSLILAGAAAGLSAAFNTPLAGVVFTIEEMSRSFEERTSGVILTAVIVAGMTSLALQGNYSYFGRVETQLEPLYAVAAVLVCGVAGGLLGGTFSSLLILGAKRLGPVRSAHPYLVALVCGLLLAVIGLAGAGLSFGTGYEEARGLLTGGECQGLPEPLLKLAATVVSYLSGIPGGIFAPSLATGAGLGASLAPLLPFAPPVAMALLGMTAYFTGVVQSPITAVVIVMEMTGDQSMLLPLMATALLAEWVSRHVCPRPLYRVLADSFLKTIHRSNTV